MRGFVDEEWQPISPGPSPGAYTSALPAGRGSSGLFFDVQFDVFDVQLPVSQRLRASLDALEIGILARRDRPGGSGLGFKAPRLFHLMPVLSRAFALSFELCRSSTVCQWFTSAAGSPRLPTQSPLSLGYQISQRDSRRGPAPLTGVPDHYGGSPTFLNCTSPSFRATLTR